MGRLVKAAMLLCTATFACGGAHRGSPPVEAANAPPPPSATPAPGSGPPPPGGTPTGPGGGGPPPATGATGYHLIDIGHAGFGVATVSRGGKVLLSNGYIDAKRFVYDIAAGTVRDAPAAAASVNDSGTIVGIRTAGKDATGQCEDYEVFLQQPDGSTQGIGNPVYGDYGTLRCWERGGYGIEVIDNQGRPVVRWRSDSTAHPGGTFRWNGSGWDRLQPVGAFVGGAAAVNDRGDIAGGGGSSEGGLVQHAAIWRNGSMTEIGTFGGTVSNARGINDADQVVGCATQTAGANDERPFLWSNGNLQRL